MKQKEYNEMMQRLDNDCRLTTEYKSLMDKSMKIINDYDPSVDSLGNIIYPLLDIRILFWTSVSAYVIMFLLD